MRKTVVLISLLFLMSCGRLQKCELTVAGFDLSKSYSENLDFNFCGNDPVYYELKFSGYLKGKFSCKYIISLVEMEKLTH